MLKGGAVVKPCAVQQNAVLREHVIDAVDHMSIEEFQNTDFSQDEDESLTMGGMQL